MVFQRVLETRRKFKVEHKNALTCQANLATTGQGRAVNLKVVAEEPQNDQSDDDAGPYDRCPGQSAAGAYVGAVVQASSIALVPLLAVTFLLL